MAMDVIDALRGLKPLLILEASEGDRRHARPERGLPEDRRSAGRAEVEFDGLTAVAYSGVQGRGPTISVTSEAKKTAMPKAEPVRRWHSWQWQTEIFPGSPRATMVSAPQEHMALRSIMLFSRCSS
jgi:hypothetical protein